MFLHRFSAAIQAVDGGTTQKASFIRAGDGKIHHQNQYHDHPNGGQQKSSGTALDLGASSVTDVLP